MGFHIYIKEVIEKPVLTPEAERQADKDNVYFYPVAEFSREDFDKMEILFADKLCELFTCDGFFLRECEHEKNQLPFVGAIRSEAVYCQRDDFDTFLQETTTPDVARLLLDFFVEGRHVATVG